MSGSSSWNAGTGRWDLMDSISAPNCLTSGLYQVIASANTDPGGIAIPTGAISVVVFFESSASDKTLISGRIGFNADATAISGISDSDADGLGYQPPVPVEYKIPTTATYLHVANNVAGAVARGIWSY